MIHQFYASCPKNLESLLESEIAGFGGSGLKVHPAGVAFSGTLSVAYRTLLWSRTASRVFLELCAGPASSADNVYALATEVPWNDHLGAETTFAVTASVIGKQFPDTPDFTALKVKDGIADFFRRTTGKRPSVDIRDPEILVNVHIERSIATLSMDLSGGGLHRRGYRTAGGAAPLRENAAAALLLRARWEHFAAEGRPLVDPMCGSGTLLIEAAMIAGDIAPGLQRKDRGLPAWRGFDAEVWELLMKEAEERRKAGAAGIPPIFGFDIDREAIRSAGENLDAAHLGDRVILKKCPLAKLRNPLPGKTGLIVTNPPYGLRIGSNAGDTLPAEMGTVFRQSFPGWSASVLSPEENFEKTACMKADRTNILYNGQLRCRVYHFEIFSDRKREDLTEKAEENLSPGAQMFGNRLRKNMKQLKKWKAQEGVTCYRLYDADMPEYALALDIYEDVFGAIHAHVQEYAPPPEIEKAKASTRLNEACAVIRSELGLSREHLFLKVRRRQRGDSQYSRLAETTERYEIEENSLRFLINLNDYLDTGIFLDHRLTRVLLRRLSAGAAFLNLFAYTGTATVSSAAGGATSTTSVDTSRTYLDWAGDNLLTNGLRGPIHRLIREDSMSFLARDRGTYGLIFIDPPTFSNSKDRAEFFDIQRDHGRLISLAASRLAPGGLIIFSTNARKFTFRPEETGGLFSEEITPLTLPPDFMRGRSGHRSWLVSLRPFHEVMEKKPKTVYALADCLMQRS